MFTGTKGDMPARLPAYGKAIRFIEYSLAPIS